MRSERMVAQALPTAPSPCVPPTINPADTTFGNTRAPREEETSSSDPRTCPYSCDNARSTSASIALRRATGSAELGVDVVQLEKNETAANEVQAVRNTRLFMTSPFKSVTHQSS